MSYLGAHSALPTSVQSTNHHADGDKRVDYLCMEKDARTVGHLNKETGLEDKGQIKFAPAERLDRANFKWADVSLRYSTALVHESHQS